MSVLAALRWLMGVALLVLLELAAPPGAAAQSCPVSGGDPVPSDSTVVGDSTVVSDSTLLAGSDTTATPEADCPPPPPPPSTQPRNPPSISLAPYNGGYSNRALCAAGCFDATVTLSTPAYVSLDAERSVALVYSSAQAWPQALVQVDAAPNSSDLPNKMSIRLKTASGAWVSFTNGSQEIFYTQGVNSTSRLAAQFDASALATGAHPYTVVVRNWWSDGTYKEWTASIRVLVVNEKSSPFGWGWSLAGLQRLLVQSDGSVAISEGDGSLAFFAKISTGFITPSGDFSKLTVSSGTYTRTYPDGTRAVFASSGRLSYVQDRWGNRTSYSYDSAGKLTGITDPAGMTTLFGYGSDGLIDWVRDPAGRVMSIAHAGRDLTWVDDAGGGTPFRTPVYGTRHELLSFYDRRSGGWSFSYDAFGKLASNAAPPVTLDGGTSSRPTTSFASWEKAVLPASGKGSSTSPEVRRDPGALRAQITDPRGNVTRLALDRWGAPTRIEEPLGRVTQLARNAAGLVSQTITPSTHRIDYTWDAKGNLLYAYDGFTQRRDNDELREHLQPAPRAPGRVGLYQALLHRGEPGQHQGGQRHGEGNTLPVGQQGTIDQAGRSPGRLDAHVLPEHGLPEHRLPPRRQAGLEREQPAPHAVSVRRVWSGEPDEGPAEPHGQHRVRPAEPRDHQHQRRGRIRLLRL